MHIQSDIQVLGSKDRALFVARYFKTGKGEYGEGDIFLGLTVPQQRGIAKQYKDLALSDLKTLLHDPIHEYRLTALMILSLQFRRAKDAERKKIYEFYLSHKQHINNWDLIDGSARDIIGMYLLDKPKERKILYTLVRSKRLWDRRIAVIATFAFLKQKDFADSFALAEMLLNDKEDLIHKAVGWMLREIGKIDKDREEAFLAKHYKIMPRTMLRYAIEKFPEKKRQKYLLK